MVLGLPGVGTIIGFVRDPSNAAYMVRGYEPLVVFAVGVAVILLPVGLLLLLGSMLSRSEKKISTSRECNTCHYRWLV